MKIKSDFVTNSSSASFVVAIKNGTTFEDFMQLYSKDIEQMVIDSENYDYFDLGVHQTSYDMLETPEEKFNFVAEALWEDFNDFRYSSMGLEDWKVKSAYGSSEDGLLLPLFLYTYSGGKGSDKIKLTSSN